MATQPKQLLDIALALPESQRAELATSLIRSLDDMPDPDAATEWASEIERRIESIDEGSIELQSWDDVMNRMSKNRDG